MQRFPVKILLAFVAIVQYTEGIDIDCSEQTNIWSPFGHMSECLVYSVISREPGTAIETVTSSAELDDYKSFYIYESPQCYYLPAGITEKFPDLTILVIAHTGLRSISNEDLKPFANLRGLYIDNSKLTSISEDLFKYNDKLEELSLQQNNIKYFDVDNLKFLKSLESFSFNQNDCFDGKAKGRINVINLFESLAKNCNAQLQSEWNQIEYSTKNSQNLEESIAISDNNSEET